LTVLTGCASTSVVPAANPGGGNGTLVLRNGWQQEMNFYVNPCNNRDVIIDVNGREGGTRVLAPGESARVTIAPGCYWVTFGPNTFGAGGTFDTVNVSAGQTVNWVLD